MLNPKEEIYRSVFKFGILLVFLAMCVYFIYKWDSGIRAHNNYCASLIGSDIKYGNDTVKILDYNIRNSQFLLSNGLLMPENLCTKLKVIK